MQEHKGGLWATCLQGLVKSALRQHIQRSRIRAWLLRLLGCLRSGPCSPGVQTAPKLNAGRAARATAYARCRSGSADEYVSTMQGGLHTGQDRAWEVS